VEPSPFPIERRGDICDSEGILAAALVVSEDKYAIDLISVLTNVRAMPWSQMLSDWGHRDTLRFDFDARLAIAFVALLFVHNELHEIAHTATGRVICGAWGQRNFNTWRVACDELRPVLVLVPLAGLVFSYGLMWLGYYLLRPRYSVTKQSVGFCLIFAAMPFGRVYTVAQSAGDEMVILRGVFPGMDPSLRLVLGLSLVSLLVAPPLYRAFSVLHRRRRILIVGGLLLLPYGLFEILVLEVANPLLQQGLLDSEGMLGAPLFVNVWTVFWALVLLLLYQHLPTALDHSRRETSTSH
jgi:hypothetical protein